MVEDHELLNRRRWREILKRENIYSLYVEDKTSNSAINAAEEKVKTVWNFEPFAQGKWNKEALFSNWYWKTWQSHTKEWKCIIDLLTNTEYGRTIIQHLEQKKQKYEFNIGQAFKIDFYSGWVISCNIYIFLDNKSPLS